MIKINRPATIPTTLAVRGAQLTQKLCKEQRRAPKKFATTTQDFKPDVYAADDVKEALIGMQYGKCAYCEARVIHISYGDVEHFRPKAAFQQGETTPLEKPGYYWLAYDWLNLLLSCQICNQRHKRNLFPLKNSAQRA